MRTVNRWTKSNLRKPGEEASAPESLRDVFRDNTQRIIAMCKAKIEEYADDPEKLKFWQEFLVESEEALRVEAEHQKLLDEEVTRRAQERVETEALRATVKARNDAELEQIQRNIDQIRSEGAAATSVHQRRIDRLQRISDSLDTVKTVAGAAALLGTLFTR